MNTEQLQELVDEANELANDDDNEAWDFFPDMFCPIVHDNGENIVCKVRDDLYVGWKNSERQWNILTPEMSEEHDGPDWSHGVYYLNTEIVITETYDESFERFNRQRMARYEAVECGYTIVD